MLSKRCVEMLIDLVDNKLTSMHVFDRDDAKEQQILEFCKKELQAMTARSRDTAVLPFAKRGARAETRLSA